MDEAGQRCADPSLVQMFMDWKKKVDSDHMLSIQNKMAPLTQSQGATLPHFDMDEFRRKMSSPGGVYKVIGTLDWINPLSSSLSGDVELDLKKLEHKIQRESPNGLPPNQVGAMDWEMVVPITDPNADPVFGSLPYISPEEDPLQVWGSMARSVELKVAESERRIWQKFRRI